MLVWVASFPRSGNTFLRIVLNRLYGVRTSVVYAVDGVAERLGAQVVGFTERPDSIVAMRASDQVHFIKTHRQRDADMHHDDRMICLVRDGRDSLVSWARQQSESPDRDFRTELERMIRRDKSQGSGSWGNTILSWLRPPMPHRALLRYEDLVADPPGQVHRALREIGLDLTPLAGAEVPSFTDLQRLDPRFFRRGTTGTHRDELPDDLHALFWSRPGNAEAMKLLGYGTTSD